MSIFTKQQITRQEALAYFQTHALDWQITKWKAQALAKAFGVDVAQHYKEDWKGVMPLYYLINVLEMYHPDVLDEEIQQVFATMKPVTYHLER